MSIRTPTTNRHRSAIKQGDGGFVQRIPGGIIRKYFNTDRDFLTEQRGFEVMSSVDPSNLFHCVKIEDGQRRIDRDSAAFRVLKVKPDAMVNFIDMEDAGDPLTHAGAVSNPSQYKKSFLIFLIQLLSLNVVFLDLHANNICFTEKSENYKFKVIDLSQVIAVSDSVATNYKHIISPIRGMITRVFECAESTIHSTLLPENNDTDGDYSELKHRYIYFLSVLLENSDRVFSRRCTPTPTKKKKNNSLSKKQKSKPFK